MGSRNTEKKLIANNWIDIPNWKYFHFALEFIYIVMFRHSDSLARGHKSCWELGNF